MRHSQTTLIVLAKRPVAGRVKTRLVPPFTPEQAASLAAAALRDTLRVCSAARFGYRLLSFDGDAAEWLPLGWALHQQSDGGLDERIVAAVETVPEGPVLLVGMDTPQLTAAALEAFEPGRYDACLGLAADGGYWAIGFANAWDAAATVLAVPMSTPSTGSTQLRRLLAAGLSVQLLDELVDVDTVDAACQVARQAPETEFAGVLELLLSAAVA